MDAIFPAGSVKASYYLSYSASNENNTKDAQPALIHCLQRRFQAPS